MLALSHGEDSLVVAPEYGGSLVEWTRRGIHLLRPPPADAMLTGHPGNLGCFPLVPFCNRIGFRRFSQGGHAYRLSANFGDHAHAIHGVGWQTPWRIEAVAADSVTLSFQHDAVGQSALAWPFPFMARLVYGIGEAGLTIRIEATNLHSEPAPMGIGAHPYFPRGPEAAIAFQAKAVWINHDNLPTTHEPISAAWDHTHGRAVDGESLDNCFTGWSGNARLPGMRIDADPVLRNLQVYTPPGADFFCVEPVSHVPDAINRDGLPEGQGMTVLGREQTLSGSMTFAPD
jgi:aldose 1-epimerase